MKTFTLPILIEKDEDGFYAECPVLDGCFTQGDTYEEAVENIKEAIWLSLKVMQDYGEKFPDPVDLGLPTVEVAL